MEVGIDKMYASDAEEEMKLGSSLEDLAFIKRVQRRLQESHGHTTEWRRETEESYDYIAGRQYSEQDIKKMEDELRPIVTFNRSDVYVNAIVGLEALNQKELKYVSRSASPEQSMQSELLTSAADYVAEDSQANAKHSYAFWDLVVCGMGWTSIRMDYTTNLQGEIAVERLSPLQMYWDKRATERNLADSRWRAHVKALPAEEVKERWPDKFDLIQQPALMMPSTGISIPADSTERLEWLDRNRVPVTLEDEIWVVRYQWYELNDVYPVPIGEQLQYLEKKDYDTLLKQVEQMAPGIDKRALRVKPMKQRKYYQAFIAGTVILERTQLKCDHFTINAMTGKYDHTKGVWYGIMRALKSPQEYLNKLYSAILHIINSNSKGGVLAENGVFENPDSAQVDWARPDRIVFVKKNSIAEGRLIQKEVGSYPNGLDRLMVFAMEMFSHTSGVNIELLGLAEKAQPGVLEAQRKQAGMTILSWAFDSYADYKRTYGKVLAKYIIKYLADDRMIRIAGDKGYEFKRLSANDLGLEYDVVVDEAVNSPDEKGRTFGVLMNLLPMLVKQGQQLPPGIYDYLPLPTSLAQELKQQAQGDPQQAQLAQMAQQLAMSLQQAEVSKTEAEANNQNAQAEKAKTQAQMEVVKTVVGS